MALLVHLADERNIGSIRRHGLRGHRCARAAADGVEHLRRGVFAVPVTRSHFLTHQWQRELRRRGVRAWIAITFRVPDCERVLFGRYNQPHRWLAASEASTTFQSSDAAALGAEVIVPRSIRPSEIHAIRWIGKAVGWRYFPEAHGREPCPCEYCTRGAFGGRRLRERAATLRG